MVLGMIGADRAQAFQTYKVRDHAVTITTAEGDGGRRSYLQTSEQAQRDRPSETIYKRSYGEPSGYPYLRTGDAGFDAAFALAMSEVAEASVSSIRDGAFQNGQAVACFCFETGDLWRYVWTRDSSYAVDLGLAWLDPRRSRDTLLFKLSRPRQLSSFGSGPQIVQDTGTGGSWPLSSDRVVWSLGASRVFEHLGAEDKQSFGRLAYEALVQTIETDRQVVYDAAAGLYRGEQSFLDWREQTYPSWTQKDVTAIGLSHALSTNVLHYKALQQASSWARKFGDTRQAERYGRWARELGERISGFFWLPEKGLFSSISSGTLKPFPLPMHDLLGQSLVILAGLATPEQAQAVFSRYPVHRAGPPVIYPQLPTPAIYHNRAVWPFVTAYALQAASLAGHAPFASAAMQSLWEGAALNLSHMENLEVLSGLPYVADGEKSGPVVNSRRQLWSVAGFASAVFDGIFGLRVQDGQLEITPRLTWEMARRWMPAQSVTLHQLRWMGKQLTIELQWPEIPAQGDGFFTLNFATLNGLLQAEALWKYEALAQQNNIQLVLELAPSQEEGRSLLQPDVGLGPNLNNREYRQVFAPMEPRLSWVDARTIRIERRELNATTWNLYLNGRLLAESLTGEIYQLASLDDRFVCLTANQKYTDGLHTSHLSSPLCREAWSQQWGQDLKSPDGASVASDHGRKHFNDWGYPQQVLETPVFQVPRQARYQVEVAFGNAFGPINTGVTAAVKWLELRDLDAGTIERAVTWMPHQSSWSVWAWSSPAFFALKPERRYLLRMSDAMNMSYLEHFAIYTGGAGGQQGPSNRINVSGLRLLLVE